MNAHRLADMEYNPETHNLYLVIIESIIDQTVATKNPVPAPDVESLLFALGPQIRDALDDGRLKSHNRINVYELGREQRDPVFRRLVTSTLQHCTDESNIHEDRLILPEDE